MSLAQTYFVKITAKAMKTLLESRYAVQLLGPYTPDRAAASSDGKRPDEGDHEDPSGSAGSSAGQMAKQHADFLAATARKQMKLAGQGYADAMITAQEARDALTDNIVAAERADADLQTVGLSVNDLKTRVPSLVLRLGFLQFYS